MTTTTIENYGTASFSTTEDGSIRMKSKNKIGDNLDMEGKGLRFNDGKRKWSYVHWKSLEPMVKVLEFGAIKYAPEDWKKGLDKKEILESMMRHLTALMDGEKNCQESGLPHMGHIQCNAMFYNFFDTENNQSSNGN